MSLLYLIENLDRSRFAPEVLFLGREGAEVGLFRKRGIALSVRSDISFYPHARNAFLSLRSLRPWEIVTRAMQVIPSALRMRSHLEADRPDIVHVNTSVLLPAGIGSSWAGVPVVWHIREPLHPGHLGLRARIVRRIIRSCSHAIIGISRFDAEPWSGDAKTRVVYNFVDFEQFDRRRDGRAARAALGLPPERPIIAMLGGVIHSKGADILVEAAALVRARRPDALFVVAGYPPTDQQSRSPIKRLLRRAVERIGLVDNIERRIIDRVRALRLEDSLRFIGLRSDIPELLSASVMLVWPATVSHFSRPVIEAGAMAKPVVASDYPSSRELVLPGETGLLVPPADPRALAEAILTLLNDPEAGRRMGERAYALARERYEARRNVQAIMTVYDDIIGGQALRARA